VTGPAPVILRHGGIAAEQLATIIGAPVAVLAAAFSDHDTGATPAAPGMLASHYAPNARLRLNAVSVAADEALLAFGPDMHIRGGAMRLNLSASGDVDEAAANLFSMLRELDRSGSASIAAMPVPMRGLGAAINDRLQRAAAPREGLGVRG
jgi:L-threonylcarbamoyladenylate synthase